MFLVDDLLMAPGKALVLVFQELAKKAQEEWLDDGPIKKELQEIYALVDAGKIGDKEFEEKECRLLERLEQIAKAKFNGKWGAAPPIDTPDAVTLDAESTDSLVPSISDELQDQNISPLTCAPEPREQPGVSILQALRPLFDGALSAGIRETLEEKFEGEGFVIEAGQSVRTVSDLIDERREQLGDTCDAAPLPELSASSASAIASGSPAEASVAVQSEASAKSTQTAPDAPIAPQSSVGAPARRVVPASAPAPVPAPVSRVETRLDQQASPVSMARVIESAVATLAITRLKVSSVTSVNKVEDGWRVTVELVERRAVPDTADLLGVYEVALDAAANVTRYERTRVRRRNDLNR